ncbi:MAG: hypothetical protein ABIH36_02930 [bacterium]
MQTIQLKRFGTVLVSRPAGLEAFSAIRASIDPDIPIQIDFNDVLTVTPSWFDEFLTQLAEYAGGKVELLPTTNASVLAILSVIGIDRKDAVADIVRRALDRMKKDQ